MFFEGEPMDAREQEFPLRHEWEEFSKAVFVRGMSAQQLTDLRRTFYGGASAMYFAVLRHLSPGDEVTESDLDFMMGLRKELHEFNEAVKRGEK
jgi:hypothetical protein